MSKTIHIFNQIRFIAGADKYDSLPLNDKLEFAFWGRSNSGKSSTINSITNNYSIARTSQRPGHTKQINIFELSGGYATFADLPGYGYARVSKTMKTQLHQLCYDYIAQRNTVNIFLLIDARRGIMEIDQEAMAIIRSLHRRFSIIFTKADLIKDKEKLIATVQENIPYMMISNKNKTGIEELRNEILKIIK